MILLMYYYVRQMISGVTNSYVKQYVSPTLEVFKEKQLVLEGNFNNFFGYANNQLGINISNNIALSIKKN